MLRLAVLWCILLAYVALCLWIICSQNPVTVEIPQLPAGLSHWRFHRFDLCRVNPPFVRMAAVLPLLALDLETPWQSYGSEPQVRSDSAVGHAFLQANAPGTFWLYRLSRCICLTFGLLGGYACYRWCARCTRPPLGL